MIFGGSTNQMDQTQTVQIAQPYKKDIQYPT
jgi:hypothetical protein